MFRIKKIVSVFFIVCCFSLSLSLTGCAVNKNRTSTEKVEKTIERGVRHIKRSGDSVVFVPKIRYKDTIIVRERKNIILKTSYSESGQIDSIECKQKAFEMVENYVKQMELKERKREKHLERSPAKDFYFNLVLIIAFLMVINKIFK